MDDDRRFTSRHWRRARRRERLDRLAGTLDGTFTRSRANRVVVGTWLVLAGVLLLLDQLDVIFIGIDGLVALLLVGLGIGKMVVAADWHDRRGAYWLLVIGLWFSVNAFTVYGAHDTWPLLVLAVGAKMIWDELAGRRPARDRSETETPHV